MSGTEPTEHTEATEQTEPAPGGIDLPNHDGDLVVVLGQRDPIIHVLPQSELWSHRAWNPDDVLVLTVNAQPVELRPGILAAEPGSSRLPRPPRSPRAEQLLVAHLRAMRARLEGQPDAAQYRPALDAALAPGLSFTERVYLISDQPPRVPVEGDDGSRMAARTATDPPVDPTDNGGWFHNLWHRLWD